jgi:acyl-CoA synthetase (AMP-forming)/AMP-acid ligase II
MAGERPQAPALHVAAGGGSTTSFAELEDLSARLAAGLSAMGLGAGDRALVMLRPGVHFVATAFALLRLGVVPVFADPGLGRRHLLPAIAAAAPRGMIAVPLLHAVRAVRPRPFSAVRVAVSAGFWPGARSLTALAATPGGAPPPAPAAPDDTAIIAFTTGSTGEPKGVCFSHRVLHAQVRALVELGRIRQDDVQLALLPLLAILGPGLGCASVLPDMDASRPATVDPAKLAAAIERYGVTLGFGSPTPWRVLADHCATRGIRLPRLSRVLVGGAPVPASLVERLRPVLGAGSAVEVVYGATEALPISSVEGGDLSAAAGSPGGRGALVGRPVGGAEVRVLRIVDGPIAAMAEDVLAPAGEVGEIAVRGEVVTPSYFERPDADALARIPDEGGAWHRMGDLGRLDAEGRLWFCGRKADRVETGAGALYTACVEPAFEAHPRVARAAILGLGARPRQRPALVVEPRRGAFPRTASARAAFAAELRALDAAPAVEDVLFRRALPLDVRHNAKILRHELVPWAEARLSGRAGP